jgi:hypothetical protein
LVSKLVLVWENKGLNVQGHEGLAVLIVFNILF